MICSTKLSIESLKRALALLERINFMKENKFPKKAVDNLIALDLSGNNDRKWNWFSSLKDWIRELEAIGDNNGSQIQEIIRKKETIITEACRKRHAEDRSRTLLSNYCESYKFLKNIDFGDCEEYLTFKFDIQNHCL